MKYSIYLCSITLFILLGIVTTPTASANHSWADYHWARTANPFTIKLGDNVTPNWDPYLKQAATDWTVSSVLDATVVSGNTNSSKGRNTPKTCAPTTGRGEVCNAKYGSTGWLGIASLWTSGSHITAGTVKLNDTYFSTATYNTPAWKALVTCQEVGHIFGLGHQDEIFDNANLNTCMDYTSNPQSNQHPNSHDYEMLELIYNSHVDTNTTIASSITNLTQDSNNAADWGLEAYRASNGRSSIFVKELGNGNRVVRHVYWAEPRGHRE